MHDINSLPEKIEGSAPLKLSGSDWSNAGFFTGLAAVATTVSHFMPVDPVSKTILATGIMGLATMLKHLIFDTRRKRVDD